MHNVSTMGFDQMKIQTLSIANGGNIRVGTEDNPYLQKGIPAKNNSEIIAKWVKISNGMGREVADPSEARKIIGL